MNEEWKPVVGFERLYEVSNHGRVRKKDKQLTFHKRSKGYPAVWIKEAKRSFMVHRLVMQAFVGECPKGMEVRHLDGNPVNSHLSNLAYGTTAQNQQDRKQHGTDNAGTRHGMSKITEDIVREIRHAWSFGFTQQSIADYFGLSNSHISNIVNYQKWSHI